MINPASISAYMHFKPADGEPLPPKEQLPTMYDLPSEDPEEPGLPDDFHYLQPLLLRETFLPTVYPAEQTYIGTDINLYYDPRNPLWHKRPDWFLVLGAEQAKTIQELRLSYVVWQEEVAPYLVLELLSEGTEDEDLGTASRKSARPIRQPPGKWEVYEKILQVPFYVVFDRYAQRLRIFALTMGRYHELALLQQGLWFAEIGLSLQVWTGAFHGVHGEWLRWFDGQGKMLPTLDEQNARTRQQLSEAEQQLNKAEQQLSMEQQRADSAEQRAKQLAAKLRALGIEPET